MSLQEQLNKKQEEINKVVQEINQLQQALNIKNQEALRLDGAAKQLQDLIEEEKKVDKGDKDE